MFTWRLTYAWSSCELYPQSRGVPDSELVRWVRIACPAVLGTPRTSPDAVAAVTDAVVDTAAGVRRDRLTPRSWYYASLDYGAYLKKTIPPNPFAKVQKATSSSRALRDHRQKRSRALAFFSPQRRRAAFEALHQGSARLRSMRGEETHDRQVTLNYLKELAKEGFCQKRK